MVKGRILSSRRLHNLVFIIDKKIQPTHNTIHIGGYITIQRVKGQQEMILIFTVAL
jgi:hypothetical protein